MCQNRTEILFDFLKQENYTDQSIYQIVDLFCHFLHSNYQEIQIDLNHESIDQKRFLLNKYQTIDTVLKEIKKEKHRNFVLAETTGGIQQNQQAVMEKLNAIVSMQKDLAWNVDCLKKKPRKKGILQDLRDPIYESEYRVLLFYAGESFKRKKTQQAVRLRIVYTLLYFLGIRLNELKEFTKEQILTALDQGQLGVKQEKTKYNHQRILPRETNEKKFFCGLKTDVELFFDYYQFMKLGCSQPNSEAVYSNPNFARLVNQDIRNAAKQGNLKGIFSSHSFRTGYITALLQKKPIHEVAKIVGHACITSTMKYDRYAYNKQEIQDTLSLIFH